MCVSLYRCEGIASKESNLVPCRDEDPCGVEVRKFWEVYPDVTRGPTQNRSLLTLSVEDATCPSVVHISPKWCHNPPVPSNWKSYWCELGHLSQEWYKAIVVHLRNRYSLSCGVWIRQIIIYLVKHCALFIWLGGVRVGVMRRRDEGGQKEVFWPHGANSSMEQWALPLHVCAANVANRCYFYSVKRQQLRKPGFCCSRTCNVIRKDIHNL